MVRLLVLQIIYLISQIKMKHIITYITFFITGIVFSQSPADTTIVSDNAIQVIARVSQNSTLLRWAPTKPIAWKQLNRYGYTIERYTIIRDGKTLSRPEGTTLTKFPLLPEPLEQWENIVQNNDQAAIIAQAIYGESFNITGGNDIETIVALSEEVEQRHTFALYTADQDFEIAKKAGLGFEDTTALPNEKYVYRVISNVPKQLNDIAYGGVFIGYQDYELLPKPLDLAINVKEANTILTWNYKIHDKVFTSYHIERSEEGAPFKRINKRPYTLLNQAADTRTGRIYYIDSVTTNRNYKYRVQGISTFGELSPYSEEVGGIARPSLAYTPHITTKTMIDNTTVELVWEFPEEGNKEIKGFTLNKSNGKGETQEVLLENIPATARKLQYNKLLPSNYFTISAVGNYETKRTSFPVLVQPIDSVPPSRPVGLTGKIDSTGVVRIKWQANTEKDIFGYRVFRGNLENEEFSQLTSNPIANTNYRDTVAIKNLNSKVYYKIVALDYRYNQSEFSDPIAIKKPDVVPPTSPVFKNFDVDKGKVNLTWAKSSSEDAVTTQLYRKENESKNWLLVYEGDTNVENFTDKKAEEGNLYSYTLVAIDESELESDPSPSISIKIPSSNKETQIRNFYGKADLVAKQITLSWSYKKEDVLEFELYKAARDKKMRLLRVVPSDTRILRDTDLAINTEYQYGIRAIFKDGRSSKLKKVVVKY